MATIKHLSSKNSNYAAAESYLTFQHNEYTGLPILDEKGRPKLRDSYLLDTLECGESSFAMACLIANRKDIFFSSPTRTVTTVRETSTSTSSSAACASAPWNGSPS